MLLHEGIVEEAANELEAVTEAFEWWRKRGALLRVQGELYSIVYADFRPNQIVWLETAQYGDWRTALREAMKAHP